LTRRLLRLAEAGRRACGDVARAARRGDGPAARAAAARLRALGREIERQAAAVRESGEAARASGAQLHAAAALLNSFWEVFEAVRAEVVGG
jgi:hypothetical protein